MTYYLWRSAEGIFFITDYKEQHNGLTKVDGRGYIKVDLKFTSTKKTDLLAEAERIVIEENKNDHGNI